MYICKFILINKIMIDETLNPSVAKSTAENSIENSETLNVNASNVTSAVEEAAAIAAAVVAAGTVVDGAAGDAVPVSEGQDGIASEAEPAAFPLRRMLPIPLRCAEPL